MGQRPHLTQSGVFTGISLAQPDHNIGIDVAHASVSD
jgi:hypothetical protein